MKQGANIKVPQEPFKFNNPSERQMVREELTNKMMELLSSYEITYAEAYSVLEQVNETLLFNSQFVSVRKQEV